MGNVDAIPNHSQNNSTSHLRGTVFRNANVRKKSTHKMRVGVCEGVSLGL